MAHEFKDGACAVCNLTEAAFAESLGMSVKCEPGLYGERVTVYDANDAADAMRLGLPVLGQDGERVVVGPVVVVAEGGGVLADQVLPSPSPSPYQRLRSTVHCCHDCKGSTKDLLHWDHPVWLCRACFDKRVASGQHSKPFPVEHWNDLPDDDASLAAVKGKADGVPSKFVKVDLRDFEFVKPKLGESIPVKVNIPAASPEGDKTVGTLTYNGLTIGFSDVIADVRDHRSHLVREEVACQFREDRRRLKVFTITQDALRILMGAWKGMGSSVVLPRFPELPADADIEDVQWDPWRRSMIVRVWSREFDVVPEGQMLPDALPTLDAPMWRAVDTQGVPELQVLRMRPEPGELFVLEHGHSASRDQVATAVDYLAEKFPETAFIAKTKDIDLSKSQPGVPVFHGGRPEPMPVIDGAELRHALARGYRANFESAPVAPEVKIEAMAKEVEKLGASVCAVCRRAVGVTAADHVVVKWGGRRTVPMHRDCAEVYTKIRHSRDAVACAVLQEYALSGWSPRTLLRGLGEVCADRRLVIEQLLKTAAKDFPVAKEAISSGDGTTQVGALAALAGFEVNSWVRLKASVPLAERIDGALRVLRVHGEHVTCRVDNLPWSEIVFKVGQLEPVPE